MVVLLSQIECEHLQSQNCVFFDWHRTIKLILYLACLLNINCSSPQLIKKGPTVYHMCPTLIMFTNHTHSPNSTVTLRTCVLGSAISTLNPFYTHSSTCYTLTPNIIEHNIILSHFRFIERLMPTIRHLSMSLFFFFFLQPPVVNRYAVIGSHLFHSNLSMLYHNVFFMVCRAHGIGFNMKVKPQNSPVCLFIIIKSCSFLQLSIEGMHMMSPRVEVTAVTSSEWQKDY